MSRGPRFLPILLIAVGGVLAVRALTGVQALPQMMAGAKAWAEELAPQPKLSKAVIKGKDGKDAAPGGDAVKSLLANPAVAPNAALVPPKPPAAPVCAPTPAELARQAGMSPAELQVLQSLGTRRGQLDAREQALDTQLQLLAAAEAKVDGKLKQLTSLKGDIQGLLGQVDTHKETEIARLVTVYEKMKPAEAAARIVLLDDAVRLPLASKMKVAVLAQVLAQMPPAEAKNITEKLADRLTAADKARDALAAASAAPPPAAATPPAAAANPAAAKSKKS
jgi:flagellar motility protein MotE (MotC chaperone)